jgi:Trk K+ transport system NAD-binding subunit
VDDAAGKDTVLVCGLGTLGEECIRVLKVYGMAVRALDIADRNAADLDVSFMRGDCRDPTALRALGVEDCRALLLVTGDTRANVEGAFAARHLSSSLRIVARIGEHYELLAGVLGNFVGYEPNRLAAGAIALAALRSELVGYFELEGHLVRVVRHQVREGDPLVGARIRDVSTHGLVVLEHRPAGAPSGQVYDRAARLFHNYDPESRIREGDVMTTVAVEGAQIEEREARVPKRVIAPRSSLVGRIRAKFHSMGRPGTVALGALFVITTAVLIAAWLVPTSDSELSHADGIFTALVLMTGGTYADLFPAFHHLTNSMRFFTICLSVIGTVSVGLLYAWLTDRLMTIRLRLPRRRPPVPAGDHVMIVGIGGVGRQAAGLFHAMHRPEVGIDSETLEEHDVPYLPMVVGSGTEPSTLEAAGVASARGLLAATGDDWRNLEIALLARTLNPDCSLVIRTSDRRFSYNIAGILPGLTTVCVPVVAGKAFAAAALGENVLNLFQLEGRTIFVVEYHVESGDGLEGRRLAEIAEGYSVMPVLHQRPGQPSTFWSIVDRAAVARPGDRMVLLGPSTSLQRIERGEMRSRVWRLTITSLRPLADKIAAAAVLAQQLAFSLEEAQKILAALPSTLPGAFYAHQLSRLRAALEQAGAVVEVAREEASGKSRIKPMGPEK